jgi:SM-20-related protein
MTENIVNNIINIELFNKEFNSKKIIKISNFLNSNFAELLFKYAIQEKNWNLSTGIKNNKYEKINTKQNEKINDIQIKNVNNAFAKNEFSYIFYRSMNNVNMSYIEFTLRKYLNSDFFINKLNEITELQLTKLTTLFMSKYSSGNFLSPHSDRGNGRLAFVINLTKFWKPYYGGILHFLNDDRTEIIDTYVPEFNNLIIFKVSEEYDIPHYVSHIAPNIKISRYSITGWFN